MSVRWLGQLEACECISGMGPLRCGRIEAGQLIASGRRAGGCEAWRGRVPAEMLEDLQRDLGGPCCVDARSLASALPCAGARDASVGPKARDRRAGCLCGEMSLVTGWPAVPTVRALETSLGLMAPAADFQAAVLEHPELCQFASDVTDRRLAEVVDRRIASLVSFWA